MARRCSVGFVAAIAALAVGTLVGGGGHRFHAAWPDVRVELRDDADREQAIDQLWLLTGAQRDRALGALAAPLALRISDASEDDQPFVAAALLDQLTSLWQGDPGAIGRGLAEHAALLRGLAAMVAQSRTRATK